MKNNSWKIKLLSTATAIIMFANSVQAACRCDMPILELTTPDVVCSGSLAITYNHNCGNEAAYPEHDAAGNCTGCKACACEVHTWQSGSGPGLVLIQATMLSANCPTLTRIKYVEVIEEGSAHPKGACCICQNGGIVADPAKVQELNVENAYKELIESAIDTIEEQISAYYQDIIDAQNVFDDAWGTISSWNDAATLAAFLISAFGGGLPALVGAVISEIADEMIGGAAKEFTQAKLDDALQLVKDEIENNKNAIDGLLIDLNNCINKIAELIACIEVC
jgi:hypothetical protein